MSKYEMLVAKAKQAYQNEDLEKAAMYYEEAFLEEVHLDDLLHLGAIYLDLKKYNRAIKIFKDIISVQDENFLAYYGLASCYNEMGRTLDAINAFKEAIRVKPDYSDAYFGIALLLDYQEDPNCEYYYLKTLEYENDHFWANANLGSFYEKKGEYDLALKYSLKAYEINKDERLICYNLGVIYAKLKQYDKALKYYLEEINKENPYINVFLNIGLLYKDIYKDYEKAKYYYLMGIAKDKEHINLWYNLGCLYALMHDDENAYNCLWYACIKDFNIREFLSQDPELKEFREKTIYQKLLQEIGG